MPRCTRTANLEVHHKRRNGDASLDNAKVLCQTCHEATSTYGVEGESPPPFDPDTKYAAKIRAGFQCECTSTGGCH